MTQLRDAKGRFARVTPPANAYPFKKTGTSDGRRDLARMLLAKTFREFYETLIGPFRFTEEEALDFLHDEFEEFLEDLQGSELAPSADWDEFT